MSNEYVFLRAAGDITVNGQRENTNEYAVIVAHQDNTKIWLHTSLEDTAGTAPSYVLNAGEYQKLYFGEFGNSSFTAITRYTWYLTIGSTDTRIWLVKTEHQQSRR